LFYFNHTARRYIYHITYYIYVCVCATGFDRFRDISGYNKNIKYNKWRGSRRANWPADHYFQSRSILRTTWCVVYYIIVISSAVITILFIRPYIFVYIIYKDRIPVIFSVATAEERNSNNDFNVYMYNIYIPTYNNIILYMRSYLY